MRRVCVRTKLAAPSTSITATVEARAVLLSNSTVSPVLLLKSTALASTVAVMDVLGAANFVRTQTLRTYEPLLVTALVYLVLALLIENVFRRLAHRLPTRSGF